MGAMGLPRAWGASAPSRANTVRLLSISHTVTAQQAPLQEGWRPASSPPMTATPTTATPSPSLPLVDRSRTCTLAMQAMQASHRWAAVRPQGHCCRVASCTFLTTTRWYNGGWNSPVRCLLSFRDCLSASGFDLPCIRSTPLSGHHVHLFCNHHVHARQGIT